MNKVAEKNRPEWRNYIHSCATLLECLHSVQVQAALRSIPSVIASLVPTGLHRGSGSLQRSSATGRSGEGAILRFERPTRPSLPATPSLLRAEAYVIVVLVIYTYRRPVAWKASTAIYSTYHPKPKVAVAALP